MSKEVTKREKDILEMMEEYRKWHKNDPVTDEKLRADIEKFLDERNQPNK